MYAACINVGYMYSYIHMPLYTYVNIYMYIYKHSYPYTYIQIYMYMNVYTCFSICMYVYIYLSVYLCIYLNSLALIITHVNTHTNTQSLLCVRLGFLTTNSARSVIWLLTHIFKNHSKCTKIHRWLPANSRSRMLQIGLLLGEILWGCLSCRDLHRHSPLLISWILGPNAFLFGLDARAKCLSWSNRYSGRAKRLSWSTRYSAQMPFLID